MKSNWEIKRLGEVCELINGKAYKKEELLNEGKYIVLRVGNFFTNTKWYYSDLELKNDKYCEDGDLLYAWSASFGPKIWSGDKVIYHYHIWKMIPNQNCLNKDFLYNFLLWDKEKIKSEQGVGTTMVHVTKGAMEKRELPIPPIEEQRGIVGVLDYVFERIASAKANIERNLQNAKDLFQSRLNQIFTEQGKGWGVKLAKDICEIKPAKKEVKINLNDESIVTFLPMPDLPILEKSTLPKQSKKLSDVYSGYTYFAEGDLLMAKITPCYENGKMSIATNLVNGVGFGSSEYIVFRCNEKLSPEYLFYFFARNEFRKEGKCNMKGAVGHKRVSKEFIENYKIPLPPLAQQEAIVTELDALKERTSLLEEKYKRKLDSLEELKKSVLQKAFAGELV